MPVASLPKVARLPNARVDPDAPPDVDRPPVLPGELELELCVVVVALVPWLFLRCDAAPSDVELCVVVLGVLVLATAVVALCDVLVAEAL